MTLPTDSSKSSSLLEVTLLKVALTRFATGFRECRPQLSPLPASQPAMLSRVLPSASRAAPLARAYASAAHGAVSTPVRTFIDPVYGSGKIPMFGETPIDESVIRQHFVVTEWSKDLAAIKGHAPGKQRPSMNRL